MAQYVIIALFGKSGSGKHYVLNKYLNGAWADKPMHKIVGVTTRPPREGEKEGEDYYFVSLSTLVDVYLKSNTIAEITTFNNWYYLSPLATLRTDKINIGIFNPTSIKQLIEDRDFRFSVFPVYVLCDDKTRLLNCCNREEEPNCLEICRRFLADEKDFDNLDNKIECYDTYVNGINNDANDRVMNLVIHQALNELDRIEKI